MVETAVTAAEGPIGIRCLRAEDCAAEESRYTDHRPRPTPSRNTAAIAR